MLHGAVRSKTIKRRFNCETCRCDLRALLVSVVSASGEKVYSIAIPVIQAEKTVDDAMQLLSFCRNIFSVALLHSGRRKRWGALRRFAQGRSLSRSVRATRGGADFRTWWLRNGCGCIGGNGHVGRENGAKRSCRIRKTKGERIHALPFFVGWKVLFISLPRLPPSCRTLSASPR